MSLIEKYNFNGYYFYTNLIQFSKDQIERLIVSKKLKFYRIKYLWTFIRYMTIKNLPILTMYLLKN